MVEGIRYIVNRTPLLSVLVIAGLIGSLMGFDNAFHQVSVETGQVISGLVKYPLNNPNYMYHMKAFTIINQLSAALLLLTGSEALASYIISCLIGMVILQAFSVMIFAINRDIYLAVLGAVFIYYMEYLGIGRVYPIHLMGHMHTFGVLGLFFPVLCLGLLGARGYRLGLFCVGLSLSIHPSLACWLILLLILSALLNLDFSKKVLKAHYKYFLAGFLISLASLALQLYFMKDLPRETTDVTQFFYRYIEYWDRHRIKFFWDYDAEKYMLFHPTYLFTLLSSFTALLGLKYFNQRESLVFIFKAFAIAGVLSLGAGLITHIPSENVPVLLITFMPGRFVNLSIVVLSSLLMGIITYYVKKHITSGYSITTLTLLPWYFLAYDTGKVNQYIFLVLSIIVVIILTVALFKNNPFSVEDGSSSIITRIRNLFVRPYGFIYKCRYVIIIPLALIFLFKVSDDIFVNRVFLPDVTNMDITSRVSKRDGLLLVTSDLSLVALQFRRPILIDIGAMDTVPFVPEASAKVNDILKKIYGISLLTHIPPPGHRNLGKLKTIVYKDLWEKRTLEKWQAIGREFNVRDIMTRADVTPMNLQLPLVEANNSIRVYEIPGL
ncbi:MAG: hypothetical protein V3V95_08765 [Thermodesulfobacteriota bacterium]